MARRTFTHPLSARLGLAQRISLLVALRWAVWGLPPALALVLGFRGLGAAGWLAVAAVCGVASVALNAWVLSLRRQFVREARLPIHLVGQLLDSHPQLSRREAELVLHGLRQFFMAHLRSGRRFVAMPSRVVDDAWHGFILHTRAYEAWCAVAFGKLLHHTPAEAMGRNPQRNDGLRRVWYWACKEESIDPRQPSRLPLLFALDKKLGIAGGFSYVADCRDIERQSGSDAHCGTSFGETGTTGAGGDPGGFGGSESADGGGAGSDGGCGGGCGGD